MSVEYSWGIVIVRSADGAVVVEGPRGSKALDTINYRDMENIHFFHMNLRLVTGSGEAALSVGKWVVPLAAGPDQCQSFIQCAMNVRA